MQFECLVSVETLLSRQKQGLSNNFTNRWDRFYASFVYVMLREGAGTENLQSLLDEISEEKFKDLEKTDLSFYLQPLPKIAPGPIIGNELGMFLPRVFILFLAGLAIIIMLSAAFNYTSLSVARSLLRSKEYGLRKSIGASKLQLIMQIILEAIIVSLISLVLAFGLLQFLLPAFSGMEMMSMLEISPRENLATYASYLGFAILTGLLSGLFPALYVAAFNPVKVLKADANLKIMKRVTIRKVLLVSQYAFSVILIISIILISRQMNYMINVNLGFNKDAVYAVEAFGKDPEQVKDLFGSLPEVSRQSYISHIPAIGQLRDIYSRRPDEVDNRRADYFGVDPDFIDCMELELIAGKDFPKDLNYENEKFIIINELAVKTFGLGSPQEAVGQSILMNDTIQVEVIGVIKDFQYVALFLNQHSLFLRILPEELDFALMHLNTKDMQATLDKMEAKWAELDPVHPMKGDFLKDEIREFYNLFEDIIYTVGFTTLLAIVVACLGLFGMATYTIQIKLKEISVRKVFGSSSKQVILLVSKSFLRMLVLASLIGLPLAYLLNNAWLSNMARRVSFGPGNLLLGALIVIMLGFLTIWSQTLRASRTNPASTLRNE